LVLALSMLVIEAGHLDAHLGFVVAARIVPMAILLRRQRVAVTWIA
jgi:hypothetical protein